MDGFELPGGFEVDSSFEVVVLSNEIISLIFGLIKFFIVILFELWKAFMDQRMHLA